MGFNMHIWEEYRDGLHSCLLFNMQISSDEKVAVTTLSLFLIFLLVSNGNSEYRIAKSQLFNYASIQLNDNCTDYVKMIW